MYHILRRIPLYITGSLVLVCTLYLFPIHVSAHTPRFVDVDQHETIMISDVDTSQAFYGTLRGSPHLYTFTFSTTTPVTFSLSIPDLEHATPDVGLLLIKRTEDRVEEITRVLAKDAVWDRWFEWFGGDSYRRGPELEETLAPGIYNLEVSTPLNTSKYVLSVGKVERLDLSPALYRNLVDVKHFFEKSSFAIIESPFVYIPSLLVVVACSLAVQGYRRRALLTSKATSNVTGGV
jgi:hypothetical protein